MMNVAVLGASNKPQRYSYQAVKLLTEHGHTVFPVHKRVKEIDGLQVYPSLSDIKQEIHTISVYVSSDISSALEDLILGTKPKRIIFNPGAENPEVEQKANDQGILTLNACTLVMLRTNQF